MQLTHQNFQAMMANRIARPSIHVVDAAHATTTTSEDNCKADTALPTVKALKIFETMDIAPVSTDQGSGLQTNKAVVWNLYKLWHAPGS